MDTTTIGIMVAVFFLGYLIGLYEGRWKHGKKLKALKNERDRARSETQETREKLAALREEFEAFQAENRALLSVKRAKGTLQVSLDEKILQPGKMSPAQHQRLLTVLSWLTPYIKQKKTSSPPPRRPIAKTPPSPAISAPLQDVSEPMPTARLSIVEQIDRILQEKIRGTELASLGLRLEEAPDGSVLVWVGMKRYQGVGAVPDPTVKALIQNVIAEWEQKHV